MNPVSCTNTHHDVTEGWLKMQNLMENQQKTFTRSG